MSYQIEPDPHRQPDTASVAVGWVTYAARCGCGSLLASATKEGVRILADSHVNGAGAGHSIVYSPNMAGSE